MEGSRGVAFKTIRIGGEDCGLQRNSAAQFMLIKMQMPPHGLHLPAFDVIVKLNRLAAPGRCCPRNISHNYRHAPQLWSLQSYTGADTLNIPEMYC